MTLVPAYVHMMLHSPLFGRVDLSSLQSVGGGAAFMPNQLREQFMSKMKTVPLWIESTLQKIHWNIHVLISYVCSIWDD
jgi:hypothetical protein